MRNLSNRAEILDERSSVTAPNGGSPDAPRAAVYRLLSGLLSGPPSTDVLRALATLDAGAPSDTREDSMLPAWADLRQVAAEAEAADVDDEFHALFIGVSRGELLPYGSWYVTGSIMAAPLARLRSDLGRLGIEREEGVCETEDHAACTCEAMGLLIESAEEIPSDVQRRFFDDHVGNWMGQFFRDLRLAKAAQFYAPVGALGERFIALERQYTALLT